MGDNRILLNGSPVELSDNAHTGADIRKELGIPPDRVVVATLADGSKQQIQDIQQIPTTITEIDTPPPFVYGTQSGGYGRTSYSERAMRVARLRAESYLVISKFRVNVNYDDEDGTWFHIERLPLPRGWNRSEAGIMIDIPCGTPGYPQIAPEWFWTNRDLATSDGRDISHLFKLGSHGVNQELWDKGWGHFCIHLRDRANWKPLTGVAFDRGDNLVTYLQIIMQVFHDQKSLVP